MNITYQPKWKEELIGSIGEHEFSIEMTMGKLHVFFPTEVTWNKNPPDWAKGKWTESRDAAEMWSKDNNIPFTIDEQAWVEFAE